MINPGPLALRTWAIAPRLYVGLRNKDVPQRCSSKSPTASSRCPNSVADRGRSSTSGQPRALEASSQAGLCSLLVSVQHMHTAAAATLFALACFTLSSTAVSKGPHTIFTVLIGERSPAAARPLGRPTRPLSHPHTCTAVLNKFSDEYSSSGRRPRLGGHAGSQPVQPHAAHRTDGV